MGTIQTSWQGLKDNFSIAVNAAAVKSSVQSAKGRLKVGEALNQRFVFLPDQVPQGLSVTPADLLALTVINANLFSGIGNKNLYGPDIQDLIHDNIIFLPIQLMFELARAIRSRLATEPSA